MYQTLRYEKQENIGILTINRPEALNALNSTVIGDLEQAITEVEKDAELGVGQRSYLGNPRSNIRRGWIRSKYLPLV